MHHYAARATTFAGGLTGAGLVLLDIGAKGSTGPLSSIERMRLIANFYAMASAAAADVIELAAPPSAAARMGIVDTLGLISTGFFGVDAALGLFRSVQKNGLAGLKPDAQRLTYAVGEVTLIRPAWDLATYTFNAAAVAYRHRINAPATSQGQTATPQGSVDIQMDEIRSSLGSSSRALRRSNSV
ncbi:hypothetical protein [Pseudomonas putida]